MSLRRMVWQVREDFPERLYVHVNDGAIAHAVIGHPTHCWTACGLTARRWSDTRSAEDDATVCMRCDRALRAGGAAPRA